MANNSLPMLSSLIRGYVLVVVATLVALAVLSATDPNQATSDAWVHAAIVAVFAVLLPLRVRTARRGSTAGRRAVVVIAAVLLVVNVVEAVLPGVFPAWMRIEMIGIALLMAVIVAVAAGVRTQR